MADHQHVQVLIDGVDGIGPRRIGAGGKHISLAADLDDVRCMPAARPLGVIGMDSAALERGDGVLDKARFVQGVSVDGDLYIVLVRHAQAAIDRCGGGAPVLMELESHSARVDLLAQSLWPTRIALAEKTQVHRQPLGGPEHPLEVPGAWGTGRGVGSSRRPRAPADHRRYPRHQGLLHLLRADKMDVRVDTAGGKYQALASDDLGPRANDDIDVGLHVRVTGLADGGDASHFDAEVRFDDPPMIHYQRIGNDRIHRLGRTALALAHAVPDHLAAAELDLLATGGMVFSTS